MEPCTTNTNSALKVHELITIRSSPPKNQLFSCGFTAFSYSIVVLFLSIQALLSAPNPDDPLSENIAKHWKSNEAEAVETG